MWMGGGGHVVHSEEWWGGWGWKTSHEAMRMEAESEANSYSPWKRIKSEISSACQQRNISARWARSINMHHRGSGLATTGPGTFVFSWLFFPPLTRTSTLGACCRSTGGERLARLLRGSSAPSSPSGLERSCNHSSHPSANRIEFIEREGRWKEQDARKSSRREIVYANFQLNSSRSHWGTKRRRLSPLRD